MNRELWLAIFVVLAGASGTFLLLPHRHGLRTPARVHAFGLGLSGLALLLFALSWSPPGPWLERLFFYLFGLASIACGTLMVTARNPVYAALWFASVVLSTSGLFLLAGAQFLAAGTVIVYAGAIIVTFLFVIMLAQMEGRSTYDRAARAPFVTTWTCFVILLAVLWSLYGAPNRAAVPRADDLATGAAPGEAARVTSIASRALRPSGSLRDADGAPKPHVASLGETLYSDHIITVELASTLLFIALIGALSIAAPRRPVRPGDRPAAPEATRA